LFVSTLVEDEIAACPEPKRSQMIGVLRGLPLRVLPVAVAVWHKLDVIVSWNMAHLVNMRKVERINAVNERTGLPRIRIHTPEEVVDL
jgi:hypothetical protein